jgi:hypothetical protein
MAGLHSRASFDFAQDRLFGALAPFDKLAGSGWRPIGYFSIAKKPQKSTRLASQESPAHI